jgi:hypothetical protein
MPWRVTDRWHNTIELTDERWKHIRFYHPDLANHRDEVLKTIRYGRRRQDSLEPMKYKYHRRTKKLFPKYNGIVVVVKLERNNFVITAYPIFRHSW